jgi:hypothetical protein
MSAGYVCEHCRATALRTAHATLEVLGDLDPSDAARQIAAEELDRALELLRHAPALRMEDKAD